MTLSKSQRRHLRTLAHTRKAVVLVGQSGATQSVLDETARALDHHELIKVKVRSGDRSERDRIVEALCAALNAQLVQRIGNVVTLYRANSANPRIVLPG
jgi:RNA-binding protein